MTYRLTSAQRCMLADCVRAGLVGWLLTCPVAGQQCRMLQARATTSSGFCFSRFATTAANHFGPDYRPRSPGLGRHVPAVDRRGGGAGQRRRAGDGDRRPAPRRRPDRGPPPLRPARDPGAGTGALHRHARRDRHRSLAGDPAWSSGSGTACAPFRRLSRVPFTSPRSDRHGEHVSPAERRRQGQAGLLRVVPRHRPAGRPVLRLRSTSPPTGPVSSAESTRR